jgi:hypothetical protein
VATKEREDASPTVQEQESRVNIPESEVTTRRNSGHRLTASILVPKQKSSNQTGMDLSKDDPYIKLGALKLINQIYRGSKLILPDLKEASCFIIEVIVNGTKYKEDA